MSVRFVPAHITFLNLVTVVAFLLVCAFRPSTAGNLAVVSFIVFWVTALMSGFLRRPAPDREWLHAEFPVNNPSAQRVKKPSAIGGHPLWDKHFD